MYYGIVQVENPRVVRGAMHSGKKWRSALYGSPNDPMTANDPGPEMITILNRFQKYKSSNTCSLAIPKEH